MIDQYVDVNDEVINVAYLGEDQLGEGLAASSLAPHSISYENGNGFDYILYNILGAILAGKNNLHTRRHFNSLKFIGFDPTGLTFC